MTIKNSFVRLIEDKLWILKNKVIGCLGLAFKPNTDDMRNAPSVDIIGLLQNEGAHIKAYDPQAMENAKKILQDVTLCPDPYTLAKGCDCLVVLTEWDEFRKLDFKKIRKGMRQAMIFDGRNLYAKDNLRELGFEYYGIGRGAGAAEGIGRVSPAALQPARRIRYVSNIAEEDLDEKSHRGGHGFGLCRSAAGRQFCQGGVSGLRPGHGSGPCRQGSGEKQLHPGYLFVGHRQGRRVGRLVAATDFR